MDKQEKISAQDRKIEELADAIKFKKLNDTRKKIYNTKLSSMLLEKINLGAFAGKVSDNDKIKSMDAYRNADKYDGELFTLAFKSSIEKYGALDEKTGERIPFIKHFLSHYNLKKRDLPQRKAEEQTMGGTSTKKSAVMLYLRKVAKLHEIPSSYVNSKVKNALNYSKVKQFLTDINATIAEQNEFDKVFNTLYINQDEQPSDEGEDTYNQSDISSKEQYDENTAVLLKLTNSVERALRCSENTSFNEYIRNYISLKIWLYLAEGNRCTELADYIDRDFIQGYLAIPVHERQQMNVDAILARVMHRKPDTIRKKRAAVERFLLEIYSGR